VAETRYTLNHGPELWIAAIGPMHLTSPLLTYIGHATTLIELDGVRILTDPLLRNWIGPLRRHAPPIEPAWREGIDAVLLSHLHYDHADRASLELLGHETRLIVPRGAGDLFRRWGFSHIDELTVGDTTAVGPVVIEATPALHQGSRPPFGPTADCLGFVIHGSRDIYFAGDTDLFPEMEGLGGSLDVALLPVWGWGPTLGSGHLNPERAAAALQLLRPRLAVPVHWGSLAPAGLRWVRPALQVRPPLDFARHAADLAPDVRVALIQPGTSMDLGSE
jgi:L-ascorbate metabolism protein UlaG (beta-lactamase superfamily)